MRIILAHGGEYQHGYDTRFGLLLHNSSNPMGPADAVSGERLATALRAPQKRGSGLSARPAVVTLASCYSGSVGSVTGVGASIAHALHADGIPMVIASQFPLSFGGSVRLVEMLYEGLLFGEDPRRLLIDVRRSLHTQFPDTHDWASITAYSSLPPSFEAQLAVVQIERARRSISVALDVADEVLVRVERTDRDGRSPRSPFDKAETVVVADMESAMKRVRDARSRLARLVDRLPSERAHILTRLASADKREATLEYETLKRQVGMAPQRELDKSVWPPLERALRLYDEAFRLDPTAYWALGQYISLFVVMRHAGRLIHIANSATEEIGKLWTLVEVQSLRDLSNSSYSRQAWARGSLIELYMLAPAIDEVDEAREPLGASPDWTARAVIQAKELAKMAQPGTFQMFSTRRKVMRYLDLYAEICPSDAFEIVTTAAEQIAQVFPAQRPEDIRRAHCFSCF